MLGKKLKPKTCKWCNEEYVPWNSLQKTCKPECAIALVKHKQDTQLARTIKQAEKVKRKEIAIRREKLKSKSDWLREAQVVINKYVRLRDYYENCISCGISYESNKHGGVWDCGHYRSRGSASHLRFNLHNMAKQCVKCNRQLSSNGVEYRKGLIKKIGIDKVEALENNYEIKRFSVDYLMRIKKVFSKKSRVLEKRINVKN